MSTTFPNLVGTPSKVKTNGNGRHGGRPSERDFTAKLRTTLAELDTIEQLRTEQLAEIAELRAEVYRHAQQAYGLTATALNAARKLRK